MSFSEDIEDFNNIQKICKLLSEMPINEIKDRQIINNIIYNIENNEQLPKSGIITGIMNKNKKQLGFTRNNYKASMEVHKTTRCMCFHYIKNNEYIYNNEGKCYIVGTCCINFFSKNKKSICNQCGDNYQGKQECCKSCKKSNKIEEDYKKKMEEKNRIELLKQKWKREREIKEEKQLQKKLKKEQELKEINDSMRIAYLKQEQLKKEKQLQKNKEINENEQMGQEDILMITKENKRIQSELLLKKELEIKKKELIELEKTKLTHLNFGPYKGCTFDYIIQHDIEYVETYFNSNIMHLLRHYQKKVILSLR